MTLIVSHNPARRGEILVETPGVGHHGVLAAVDRARAASRLWAQGGAARRAVALHTAAERVEQAGEELAAPSAARRPPATAHANKSRGPGLPHQDPDCDDAVRRMDT